MCDESVPAGDWTLHDEDGFLGLVGPVLERRDGDRIVLGFRADAKHRNKRGVVQGGMLVTLADRAMGVTASTALNDQPVATVQLDTHFVSAGRIGEFIVADVDIVRVTRSLAFIDARLLADERLLMTARGIWKILTNPG
ncbi:PaaI family thioesterase [Salinisphaera aquimarina]|uniref:PaaI family thioesterase n=1 Tax=Salinisphaera aquimarina TaxID=2094031 RepID=A0ABV7EN99_9GAMM